ncbi:MAG: Mannose-1-phosphate guanylyltransferase [Microgenomates group bacterium Gr01-1014_16]|nr:MAG: Mannose-1-phosphate guanylyltransferase [Microgenomates group bacterium Gr01-1014_16]
MIPVIICGGFGTKLWPISRRHMPKQFLPLVKGRSLLQINYETLRTKFEPQGIYISVNEEQAKIVKEQIPELPFENYILEPEMRNQGPATGLIAATLLKLGFADEPFMVVQVDDLREPVEEFLRMLDVCDQLARMETKYITGGFKPDSLVQGVDYLVKGEKISQDGEIGVFKVAKYLWRKSVEEIEAHIKDGLLLVHANHSCMTPKNFITMLKTYRPDWYEPLTNIINGSDVKTEYAKMAPGPIEEVTEQVHARGESLVVELPFKWVDIGTWKSLSEFSIANDLYHPPGNIIDLDGKDNFVEVADKNKVVALVGVNNLAVIDTPGGLLVCPLDQSGRVNEIVKIIESKGLNAL